MTARRALWWGLTAVLTLAVAAVAVFGTWQVIRMIRPVPADSAPMRQTVLDVAKSSTVKLLTYSPENVESQLSDAASLTVGRFHDEYTETTRNTVIPTAKQKNIRAEASVPAAAVESLNADSATMIVFVDQKTTVGAETPTDTASVVRLRMKKVNGEWLIEELNPI